MRKSLLLVAFALAIAGPPLSSAQEHNWPGWIGRVDWLEGYYARNPQRAFRDPYDMRAYRRFVRGYREVIWKVDSACDGQEIHPDWPNWIAAPCDIGR